MTDLLKDTLTERADGATPPGLDLDAIISTGDRRIRCRRTVAVLGTAMVTLAVLATGLTLLKPADDQPAPVATPFTERRATYAVGSDIHYGPDVISIAPKKINAFVQTDAGFVFTAVNDTGLFLANGSTVRRISNVPGELTPLTAASKGNLVGWIEGFSDRYESVIYDVAAGREVVRTPLGNKVSPNLSLVQAPRIIAIDNGYAYFGTLKGVYRWDLKTGEQQEILESVLPNSMRTVSNSMFLYQRPLQHPVAGVNLALADNPASTRATSTRATRATSPPQRSTSSQPLTTPNSSPHPPPP